MLQLRLVVVDFMRSWLRLAISLVPAILIAATVFVIGSMTFDEPADGKQHPFDLRDFLGTLLLVNVLSLFWVLPCAFLGAPFLPFRRWLVTSKFPYLRPAYCFVLAYGPLWLFAIYRGDIWHGFWTFLALYELVALAVGVQFGRSKWAEWTIPPVENSIGPTASLSSTDCIGDA